MDWGNMKIDDIRESISVYQLRGIDGRPSLAGVSREELLLLIKKISSQVLKELVEIDLDKAVEEYRRVYSDPASFPSDIDLKMFLEPLTPLDNYPLPSYKPLLRSFEGDLLAGFDSSSHSPRGHGDPSYLLVNMGFNLWGYGRGKNLSERRYVPYFVLIKNYEVDLRVIEKFVEHEFIREFVDYLIDIRDRMGYRDIYLFFDESFNLSYTYSFAKELRDVYIELYRDLFEYLDKRNILYAGVFYTGSTLISKVLKSMGRIDFEVRDRAIMDVILEEGSHSQVFHVYSEALEEHGIDVYAVYLKLSDYNVIRIEFPSRIYESRRYVDVLRAVYLDAIRGQGYPYLLGKAHESCVLRGDIRRFIEVDVANTLKGSYVKSISGKSLRKWRRLV